MEKEVKLILLPTRDSSNSFSFDMQTKHLYIVDEHAHIDIGTWMVDPETNVVMKCYNISSGLKAWKENGWFKLICTTDPTPIASGVPGISDEFIKQFIAANGKLKVIVNYKCQANGNKLYTCNQNTCCCASHWAIPYTDSLNNAILRIVPEIEYAPTKEEHYNNVQRLLRKKVDSIEEAAKIEFDKRLATKTEEKYYPIWLMAFKVGVQHAINYYKINTNGERS